MVIIFVKSHLKHASGQFDQAGGGTIFLGALTAQQLKREGLDSVESAKLLARGAVSETERVMGDGGKAKTKISECLPDIGDEIQATEAVNKNKASKHGWKPPTVEDEVLPDSEKRYL
ncbi:MAG: hypothetical protein MMC33_004889 [Icmadophila ericetorum]|nr:hypothetical protein [Icmadophila ericetorum]